MPFLSIDVVNEAREILKHIVKSMREEYIAVCTYLRNFFYIVRSVIAKMLYDSIVSYALKLKKI